MWLTNPGHGLARPWPVAQAWEPYIPQEPMGPTTLGSHGPAPLAVDMSHDPRKKPKRATRLYRKSREIMRKLSFHRGLVSEGFEQL